MRDVSYLTPTAQLLVGGLVLVAGLAWPPLFFIVFLILIGRFVSRARRGSKRGVLAAGGLIVALTIALTYLLANLAPVVLVVGVGTVIWLIGPRLSSRSPA